MAIGNILVGTSANVKHGPSQGFGFVCLVVLWVLEHSFVGKKNKICHSCWKFSLVSHLVKKSRLEGQKGTISGRLLTHEVVLWRESSQGWRHIQELNDWFLPCSKQQIEEWKDAACLAGSPLPYDFFWQADWGSWHPWQVRDTQKRSTESWQPSQQPGQGHLGFN